MEMHRASLGGTIDPVKPAARKRLSHPPHRSLLRWCGAAGILGGVLFVAWGYIDGPGFPESLVAVQVFAFIVPVLFLATVVGLCVLWGNRLGKLRWMGMALVVYGVGWGLVVASVGGKAVWIYLAQRGWPHYPADGLLFMLTGLTLLGIAAARSGPPRGAALVLATGVFGLVYCVTDSGAVLETRPVHVGFGLLFSLGWIASGLGLLAAGTRQARRPRTSG